jgi:staygreen protein
MDSRAATREVTLKPKAPPATLHQAAKRVLPGGARHVVLFEDRITVRDRTTDEALPRRYTLTHHDRVGDIVLSIGREYDQEASDRSRTRQNRGEILAELVGDEPRLQVWCQVSDDLAGKRANSAARRKHSEKEMPHALAVIRYGDRFFFERHPELDQAEVVVAFDSAAPSGAEQYYGRITDYRVTRIAGESRRLLAGAAVLAALGIGALVVRLRRDR